MRAACTVAVLACAAWVGCDSKPPGMEPGELGLNAPRRIVALGRLEPAGGVIPISSLPGERLDHFASGISEGASVKSGAPLAEMDSFELRQKQVDSVEAKRLLAKQQQEHETIVAQAQQKQAAASLAQAQAKLREALAQRQRLDNLSEAAAIAQEDYKLLTDLQRSDPALVTEHQLRKQRNQSDRAAKEYEAAEATYGPSVEAARKAVDAAVASVELAEQNVDFAAHFQQTMAIEKDKEVAEAMRDQAVLRAPGEEGDAAEYTVLQILVHPGEQVAQMPILQVGDLSKMVCIAEVYEADAKELSENQTATIRSSAFAGKLAGGPGGTGGGIKARVTQIGRVISSPGLTNRNPLAPSDRSVVEVRLAIDPDDKNAMEQARRLIGLQVTVEFDNSEEPSATAKAK